MIKFTQDEYKDYTGENLSTKLTPDTDGKNVQRFIDFNCREIDDYIRSIDVNMLKVGYDKLTSFQIERIKEACIVHSLERYNYGTVYYDESGLPKEIAISKRAKRLLSDILYRGV